MDCADQHPTGCLFHKTPALSLVDVMRVTMACDLSHAAWPSLTWPQLPEAFI